jgi:hypothetical protein
MDQTHARISKVFGHQDWDFIEKQKLAIKSRLHLDKRFFRTLENLNDFIARRANAIRISPARPVRTEDPQVELDRLFDRLVAIHKKGVVERRRRIDSQLNEVFRLKGISPFLKRSVEIEIPAINQPIRAPYAFQNGRFNLIEPMQFESLSPKAVFAKASKQAVEGQFIYEQPDPRLGPLKLVVVANFDRHQVNEFRTVQTIFDKHSVDLYTLDRIDPLVNQIRVAAEQHHEA